LDSILFEPVVPPTLDRGFGSPFRVNATISEQPGMLVAAIPQRRCFETAHASVFAARRMVARERNDDASAK
jgi:hypothetical protein